jgi:hypothetical protein
MKAEEIVNKMIEEMPFTVANSNIPYIMEAMKLYARIQIEKDRERVIENTSLVDRLKLIKTYSNTPIILD